MWAVLSKIGIPEDFINILKYLYTTGTVNVTINGHIGPRIPVKCSMRQGDPISCPLFDIVIEGLAQMLIQSAGISRVTVDGKNIKAALFADDTTIILRNNRRQTKQ